jgi:hypothetical protein
VAFSKAKKKQRWASNLWVINQVWTKAFFFSHLFGWTVAFIQTFWIVAEIRKAGKKRGL